MRNTLPIWSVLLLAAAVGSAQTPAPTLGLDSTLTLNPFLVAAVGSAQTTPSQSPPVQAGPAPAQTGPAQAKPAGATPARTEAAKASAVTTNAPPGQAARLLQVQPHPSFLGGVPELAFNGPRANELTRGRHTYSGIVVQIIKADRRLQLLNPLAPSRYGSGWDNLERFSPTGRGPMLKLFSIDF